MLSFYTVLSPTTKLTNNTLRSTAVNRSSQTVPRGQATTYSVNHVFLNSLLYVLDLLSFKSIHQHHLQGGKGNIQDN